MPHLATTSFALRPTILYFKVKCIQIITEILVELPAIVMSKTGLSHLVDIWDGCVGNIYELPVYKVCEKVLICLPPVLVALGGIVSCGIFCDEDL